MSNTIDLTTCVPGQKLKSRHGLILTYVKFVPSAPYPHEIKYPNGSRGTRNNDGTVFLHKRLPEDEDVVEILPLD
jgi:hypothetical protein